MNKKVLALLIGRICMWCAALAATIYWIYWSFKIYDGGLLDEHNYATQLRPHFYLGMGIAVGCILVSFVLRWFSDRIRRQEKHSVG